MFGAKHVWRKPRRFGYIPRYYDPEKEACEERRRELSGDVETAAQGEEYSPGMYVRRQALLRRGHTPRHKKEHDATTRRRALIALIVLVLGVIYMFS